MEQGMVLDKINEAYYSETPTGHAQRVRIHWICGHVSGRTVLDIGCSQGITCILLGREAKEVLGIDIARESIAYAQNALAHEHDSVRQRVRFECMDLFEHTIDSKFDTVIMTEVLEHLANPDEAVKMASKLVAPGGRYICMTPFGVSDLIDHKKTYYAYELFKTIETQFEIYDYELVGHWLGVVCGLRDKNSGIIDFNEHLKKFEEYFLNTERRHISKEKALVETHRSSELKAKIEKMELAAEQAKVQSELQSTLEIRKAEFLQALESERKLLKEHEVEWRKKIETLLTERYELTMAHRDMLDKMQERHEAGEKELCEKTEAERKAHRAREAELNARVESLLTQRNELAASHNEMLSKMQAKNDEKYRADITAFQFREKELIIEVEKSKAAIEQKQLMFAQKESKFEEIISLINLDMDVKIKDALNLGKLREYEMKRQLFLYDAEIQRIMQQLREKDMSINTLEEHNANLQRQNDNLQQQNAELVWTHNDTLNSKKFKLAQIIAHTVKNPLKIFLWPVWIFRLLKR